MQCPSWSTIASGSVPLSPLFLRSHLNKWFTPGFHATNPHIPKYSCPHTREPWELVEAFLSFVGVSLINLRQRQVLLWSAPSGVCVFLPSTVHKANGGANTQRADLLFLFQHQLSHYQGHLDREMAKWGWMPGGGIWEFVQWLSPAGQRTDPVRLPQLTADVSFAGVDLHEAKYSQFSWESLACSGPAFYSFRSPVRLPPTPNCRYLYK